MQNLLLFVLILIVLILLIGTLFIPMKNSLSTAVTTMYTTGAYSYNYSSTTINYGKQQNVPVCNGKQLLAISPMQTNQISTVVPLGNFAPPGHVTPTPHLYLRYLYPSNPNLPMLTTIYSPANMVITGIWLFNNTSDNPSFVSYRIDFQLCSNVTGYFIHIINLTNQKLLSAFHPPYDMVQVSNVGAANPDHNYYKSVSINVSVGDILGTGGGSSILPGALDFGLSDNRVNFTVANPARYSSSDLHYVCPLDYLPQSVSTVLYGRLGDFNGRLYSIGNPQCGSVYQDLPGTAQGIWLLKNQNTTSNSTIFNVLSDLTLGHSNYDHTTGIFSMGGSLGQIGFNTQTVYNFTPQSLGKVNLDFNKVTPGGIFCYQAYAQNYIPGNRNATILIQMLNSTALKIGRSNLTTCGQGPWQFSSSMTFIR